MVQWSKKDHLRVTDEMYLKMDCLVLEDVLFLVLDLVSCEHNQ